MTVFLSPPAGKSQVHLPDDNVDASQWKTGYPAGRLADKAQAPPHPHGCPACPHPVIGPAIIGSPNVFINNLPALRVGDIGIHAACCGPNMWRADTGTPSVIINGRHAHRKNDKTLHCGAFAGNLIEGSPDVFFPTDGKVEISVSRPLLRRT
jgi:uncharacterized Zn-binding protein involved in type VI secretion